ncbi:MAG: dihydrolipoyl dehydrogenase [Candidatus Omnitrophica bacterium]|nr:dihydrolipoyl dehydrogenase [Candidatus Omnitrophota bacterium]
MTNTQLLVIGAGPGGYPAAFLAADLGLNVTLVDTQPNPGGVCLFKGCIPSKALLHAAKVLTDAKEANEIGIDFGTPSIDLSKIREWKNGVVTKLTNGLGILSKQRKINFIQGRASFSDSSTVIIKRIDGTEQAITFDNAIIATGSSPATLPFLPQSLHVMDSTDALKLDDIPGKLLVLGGGYIGLELGTAYNALGSEVSVVEMMPTLLPGVDRDLVHVLTKRIKSQFADVKLNTKVTNVTETADGLSVTFEDKKGQTETTTYDKILVAVGRSPNTGSLGLQNTSVKLNDRGFVTVTPNRQTTDSRIYAIGDVVGNPMLAHKASHEGRVAIESIMGKDAVFEPKTIPAVVFTDPEIAVCGLTGTQAKEQGLDVKVEKFPWAASGRAITLNRAEGLTKLIIDPKTEKLLGMAIVGVSAGEMIAEGVLAIEMGACAADLKSSIHPHPTLSETVMETAESFFGLATHIYKIKK